MNQLYNFIGALLVTVFFLIGGGKLLHRWLQPEEDQ